MPESERKLIRQFRRLAKSGRALVKGIGDDAAVLRIPRGHEVLVTTDFSLENVHFRREWHSAEAVGWRCLTRGLSDIAAMGGEPQAAFLSLAVGRDVSQKWVDGFVKGLLGLARRYKVPLAGGDTAQSTGGIQADIVVVGSVPRGRAVLRSGAKPGDSIYVTGQLGVGSMALTILEKGRKPGRQFEKHFHPEPRIAVGKWLRERGIATAMIDISDGLSTDLDHICEESGVGAEVEPEAIPRARVGRRKSALADLKYALHGGDEYELILTSSRPVPAKIAGVSVTKIGEITSRKGMRLVDRAGKVTKLEARGWEHFARGKRRKSK